MGFHALIGAAALALVATGAAAQTQSTPRIDARQEMQQQRIGQGAASGALTAREQKQLGVGQRHVQRMEDRAVGDGTVTFKERARIEHAQDVQSRRIYRQKHDRQSD